MIFLNSIKCRRARRISWRKCSMLVLNIVIPLPSACSIHSCTLKATISHTSFNAVISVRMKSNSLRMWEINKWIRKKWSDHLLFILQGNCQWMEAWIRLDRFRHVRIPRLVTLSEKVSPRPDQVQVFLTKDVPIALITTWWEHHLAENQPIILCSKQRWSKTATILRSSAARLKNAKTEIQKSMKKIVMSAKKIHPYAIQSIKWISRNRWRTRLRKTTTIPNLLNPLDPPPPHPHLNTRNHHFQENDDTPTRQTNLRPNMVKFVRSFALSLFFLSFSA